jgi:hypothetical protein
MENSSKRSPFEVYFFTFSITTFKYSMLAAVKPLLIICQKYPAAENRMSVYPLHIQPNTAGENETTTTPHRTAPLINNQQSTIHQTNQTHLTTAESTMSPIVSHMPLLYTLPYKKYSEDTTIKLVMFFSTVTVATPRSFSAQKDVTIIPTKIIFAGYQTRTMLQLNGSTLIYPLVLNSWTSTTHIAHWKNSSESGALNSNEDRAALFKRVYSTLECT